jgi:hypothetical protein
MLLSDIGGVFFKDSNPTSHSYVILFQKSPQDQRPSSGLTQVLSVLLESQSPPKPVPDVPSLSLKGIWVESSQRIRELVFPFSPFLLPTNQNES